MDGSRFDALTRALAVPKTRRGFVGALAALGAAFAGGHRDADAQTCREVAQRCTAARPCCDGLSCVAKICVPNPGVPACTSPGAACPAARPCCPGTTCAGGVCCPGPLACGDQCCTGGTLCQNGLCQSPTGGLGCPAGQTNCGAAGCRDLGTDPGNCGSCGQVCPSGICQAGGCVACAPGSVPIGGACCPEANVCGNACLAEPCIAGQATCEVCDPAQGTCVPAQDGISCGALLYDVCCGGACTHLHIDEANCGACGVACSGFGVVCLSAECCQELRRPTSGGSCGPGVPCCTGVCEAGTCCQPEGRICAGGGCCDGLVCSADRVCVAAPPTITTTTTAAPTTTSTTSTTRPIQGTCAAGADYCADGLSKCNENPDCFCFETLTGATACVDSGHFSGCTSDEECTSMTGLGSVCVQLSGDICGGGFTTCHRPCPPPAASGVPITGPGYS